MISSVFCSKSRTVPEELHGMRLENLRDRIKNEGLIFKIRVAGSKLAQGDML